MEELQDEARSKAEPKNAQPIELKVEYRKLNTFFSDYTKNILHGGTFIKTDVPLKIGTKFLFKLLLPVDMPPLEIKGEVEWIRLASEAEAARKEGQESEPGMGIKYIYDDDAQRKALDDTVAKLMIDALGERIYKKLTASK